MLVIATESIGRSQPLIDVARELSLTLSYFGSAETLDNLLGGQSRRFVVLEEQDISDGIVDALMPASEPAKIGLVICADREGAADKQPFARC